MSGRPMTIAQRELIEALRKQHNISTGVWDQWCWRIFEVRFDELNVRQATAMIHSLKYEKDEIKREIQRIAGQRSLL